MIINRTLLSNFCVLNKKKKKKKNIQNEILNPTILLLPLSNHGRQTMSKNPPICPRPSYT